MIQESEIRIGNWVSSEDGVFPFQISCNDIKAISEGGKAYAIPITPEILGKCGFENLHTEECDSFSLSPLLIEFIPDGTISIRIELGIESYAYVVYKEYLHQLQNLYFALTDKELQIEL